VKMSLFFFVVSIISPIFDWDWATPTLAFQLGFQVDEEPNSWLGRELLLRLSCPSTLVAIWNIISFNSIKCFNSIIFVILLFNPFKNLAIMAFLSFIILAQTIVIFIFLWFSSTYFVPWPKHCNFWYNSL
jgi:hypothetical protein